MFIIRRSDAFYVVLGFLTNQLCQSPCDALDNINVAGNLSVSNKEVATERTRLSDRNFHHQENGRAEGFLSNLLGSFVMRWICSENQKGHQTHKARGYSSSSFHVFTLSVSKRLATGGAE